MTYFLNNLKKFKWKLAKAQGWKNIFRGGGGGGEMPPPPFNHPKKKHATNTIFMCSSYIFLPSSSHFLPYSSIYPPTHSHYPVQTFSSKPNTLPTTIFLRSLLVSPPVDSLPSLPLFYQTHFHLFPLILQLLPPKISLHCYSCTLLLPPNNLLPTLICVDSSFLHASILLLSNSTCPFSLDIHITFPTHSSALFTIFSKWTLPHSFLSNHTPRYLNSSTPSIITLPIFQLNPPSLFPTTIIVLFLLLNFILHLIAYAWTTFNIVCSSIPSLRLHNAIRIHKSPTSKVL